MSDLRTHLVTARTVAQRVRAARRAGVHARLDSLEAEVLVVPLARREDAEVEEILARYRSVI